MTSKLLREAALAQAASLVFAGGFAVFADEAAAQSPAPAAGAAYSSLFTAAACGEGASAALAADCGPLARGNVAGLSAGNISVMIPTQFSALTSLATRDAQEQQDEMQRRIEEERRKAQAAQQGEFIPPYKRRLAGPDPGGAGDPFSRLSLFVSPKFSWLQRDATVNERGFDGDTQGVQFGGDYRLTDKALAGLAFFYDHGSTTFDDSAGSVDSNSYTLTLFGNYQVTDALHLDATLGGGFSDFTTHRIGAVTGLSSPLDERGSTNGRNISASFGAGYDIPLGAAELGPFARMTWLRNWVNGFTESGSTGLEQTASKRAINSVTSDLGLRASYAWGMSWGVVVPQARAEWEHEFARGNSGSLIGFAGNPSAGTLLIGGDSPDRDYAHLGFGTLFVLPNGWQPFFDFEALVGDRLLSRQTLTLGLRVEL